jgi:cytochrome c oxidase cbb3-type subunit 2
VNRGPLIFLGLFLALSASFYGMVLVPQIELGRQVETKAVGSEDTYPVMPPGLARQGAEVYRANGCVYCHSQQVRATKADLERWGKRRTVAPDYLFDSPVQLGSLRAGPDLANIGARPRGDEWQLQHLYAPRSQVEGSTMPAYRYLFDLRKAAGAASTNALKLTGKFALPPGWEVVPKPQAVQLVAYLNSLRSEIGLFEAPLPLPPAKTNAPAATGTNAPPSAADMSRKYE